MDGIQTAVTSLAVVAIVILMVLIVCHYLGPRATAWVRSNREEKIGLSNNKLYNANGYLIHSGSDILLGSTGSFKRFDSIDRDYRQVRQSSSLSSPPWGLGGPSEIPPQPLRPAPSPTQRGPVISSPPRSPKKQHSLSESSKSSVIPRPVARRQMSSPGTSTFRQIDLSREVQQLVNGPRSCTNPFLNGSLSNNNDSNQPGYTVKTASIFVENEKGRNPFKKNRLTSDDTLTESDAELNEDGDGMMDDGTYVFDFDPNKIQTFLDREDSLKRAQASITRLELAAGRRQSKQNGCGELINFSPTDDKEKQIKKQQQITPKTRRRSAGDGVSSTGIRKHTDSPCTDAFENLNLNPNIAYDIRRQKQSYQTRNRSMSETEVTTGGGNGYHNGSSISSNNNNNAKRQLRSHRKMDRSMSVSSNSSSVTSGIVATKVSTNPFVSCSVSDVGDLKDYNNKTGSTLHKTLSDNYLADVQLASSSDKGTGCIRSVSQTWSFGSGLSTGRPPLARQNSASLSLTKSLSSSVESNTTDVSSAMDNISLKRAVSCDSVSSESSVILADLEQPTPPVTGYLCIGLHYDKNSTTEDGSELIVTVLEAKELIGPNDATTLDTFVRIYLVPDEQCAMQTKLFKNSKCPSYQETFSFWVSKTKTKQQQQQQQQPQQKQSYGRRSLWFHLYHSGLKAHTLIGETEMQLPMEVQRPITTWLALSDSRVKSSTWGELMFSLSYLPTAERLTIVVVKARNLKLNINDQTDLQNVYVKVYLLKNDKKVSKKRTSMKRGERSPIYNESMIFSVPPYMLSSIQVRLTVINQSESYNNLQEIAINPIGHVIVGSGTTGKGLRHWHQMISSLRKPVAMWHVLRRTAGKSHKN